jgi:hypothetical protein
MSTRDLTFFVDLDGTLKTEAGAVPPFQVDIVEVESGMNKYDIGIRPHIHDFLKCAKSKGRVVLSTASGRRYARKMLRAMGISHYFDDIISAEVFSRGIKHYSNCVFIDNDGESGELKMSKMASSRGSTIKRNDLWIIDTFNGSTDDTTMLELIDEINNLESGT